MAAASTFNGFMKPRVHYYISESKWAYIDRLFHIRSDRMKSFSSCCGVDETVTGNGFELPGPLF